MNGRERWLVGVLVLMACGGGSVLPETQDHKLAVSSAGPPAHGMVRPRDFHPQAKVSPRADGEPIQWWGGPVMTETANVYFIWYGDWSGHPNADAILGGYIRNLSGSAYYAINTSYYQVNDDRSITRVPNSVKLAGSVNDNYSQGSQVSQAEVTAAVVHAIAQGGLPIDENGVYMVLTSSDVTHPGFCGGFCGYHSRFNMRNGSQVSDIKFAFVGNADEQCPRSCGAQQITPNGDPGVDSMVSIVAHELEETTSDPDVNAWMDASGEENGDKCAWTFGQSNQVQTSAGAAFYNVVLGKNKYLIQQNWLNSTTSGCTMGFPQPAAL
jgi:hypothetical protein